MWDWRGVLGVGSLEEMVGYGHGHGGTVDR